MDMNLVTNSQGNPFVIAGERARILELLPQEEKQPFLDREYLTAKALSALVTKSTPTSLTTSLEE